MILAFLMMISISYSQDSKTIKISTLKNIHREIEKCDSLKIRYNELLEELTSLQDSISLSLTKINQLNLDKAVLKTELKTIKETKPLSDFKRFNVSVQLGAQPLFIDNDFSVKPYFGLGVGYTIFRF